MLLKVTPTLLFQYLVHNNVCNCGIETSSGVISVTLKNIPKPTPTGGQVLVKIKASAIQPSDILNSKGLFPHITFPRTLGRDFSGIIVDGPSHLLNKHVFGTSGNTFSFTTDGAHAEYAVVPIDGILVKPPSLSWAQAALVGVPCSTAIQILDRGYVKTDESVVDLGGTGSVGSWLAWLAKARGCHVITVGRRGTDISSTSDPKLEGIAASTDNKGANVVVDTVGDLALTRAAIDGLGLRGRLVTITAPRSGSTELAMDLLPFCRKEVSLLSCNTVDYSQAYMTRLLNEHLLPLLEQRADNMPVIKATGIGIEQALEAYRGETGEAVIVFDD